MISHTRERAIELYDQPGKFDVGTLTATPGVMLDLEEQHGNEAPVYLGACVLRHRQGDWGEIDQQDKQTNDAAVVSGHRIISAYPIDQGADGGPTFWLITEADRAYTTALLPSEY